MKTGALILLCSLPAFAQDSFVRNQAWCAKKAEANIAATKRNRPEVAATILTYLYEYSPRRHACVAVMEYRTQEKDGVYAQVLARNMVTNQPMRGFADIYLVPIDDKQGRIDAVNRLFDEYSR